MAASTDVDGSELAKKRGNRSAGFYEIAPGMTAQNGLRACHGRSPVIDGADESLPGKNIMWISRNGSRPVILGPERSHVR